MPTAHPLRPRIKRLAAEEQRRMMRDLRVALDKLQAAGGSADALAHSAGWAAGTIERALAAMGEERARADQAAYYARVRERSIRRSASP